MRALDVFNLKSLLLRFLYKVTTKYEVYKKIIWVRKLQAAKQIIPNGTMT